MTGYVMRPSPRSAHTDSHQCVYIEDVGSMHGTYVEDRRIASHERHRLYSDDLVKFGNEVTRGPGTCLVNDEPAPFCCHQPIRWLPLRNELKRGTRSDISTLPESFPPLHVLVLYSWVDDRYSARFAHPPSYADAVTGSSGRSQDTQRISQVELPPNTFQVPDYDDEEVEDNEEISFIQETVLKPKLEVVVPPPTRDSQDSVQSYNIDASSEIPGQGVEVTLSNPNPPPPSFASSPLPPAYSSIDHSSSPAIYTSIETSGPSGLSEAERQADKRAMSLGEPPTSSTRSSVSADTQSPTKSSSSLPTSSLSKESDAQTNTNVKLSVNHQTSIQATDLTKRTIVVDEDLTQSEFDSDEAYSPDLMVDDSEDGQRRDAPTDYGSDSDEEALLVAETRNTELPHVEDNSTDSESSRSDISDDIGMERDEDFFVHPGTKMPGTKNSLPNTAVNQSDRKSTEQESIPYNMRPGNFAMHATRLTLPSNPLNRAPSPSDSAMAKSYDFASGSPGVAGGLYPYTNPQPWSNPMASAYGTAWSCTLDGRSHGPYDERFGGYQYPYGASYAPGQLTSDSFRTYPSSMCVLGDQSFHPEQNGAKQSEQPSGSDRLQPPSQPPISISNIPNNASDDVTHLPQNHPKSAAKVSVDSIVERVLDEPLSTRNENKLKRKADDISSDNTGELVVENPKQVTQIEDAQRPACLPHLKTASVAQVKALQNVPSASGREEERPAKRARTTVKTRKPSFATLVATAVAGAVVGGVGVVAALVSLPPDFFV